MQTQDQLITATIHALESLGPKYLLVQLQPNQSYPYQPGQYCFVHFQDQEGDFKRPYSIASAPNPNNRLEFCLIQNSDPRTIQALSSLKIGDLLSISPAKGRFQRPNPDRNAVFIAGGSGITPLRSMIQCRLEDSQQPAVKPSTTLVYGCEDAGECPYLEDFQRLTGKTPGFELLVYTQRNDQNLAGLHFGLPTDGLHQAIDPEADYFMCGPPAMLDECRKILSKAGIAEDQIFIDQY